MLILVFQTFCFFFTACLLNTYKSGERTCLPCPANSHTEKPGQMKSGCVCDEGFTGPAGGPCTDVNECTPNSGKGKGMGVIPHCN